MSKEILHLPLTSAPGELTLQRGSGLPAWRDGQHVLWIPGHGSWPAGGLLESWGGGLPGLSLDRLPLGLSPALFPISGTSCPPWDRRGSPCLYSEPLSPD